jgi:5'-3' exonuclease
LRSGSKLSNQDVKLDRLIDDFVFLTFLVGNDFLPHLPTLRIRESAFPLLFKIYRQVVPQQGYLTKHHQLRYVALGHFLEALGRKEDSVSALLCV